MDGPEEMEPDFAYAADAWMEHQMTMENLRHLGEIIRISYEFERRKTVERAGEAPQTA